MRTSVDHWHSGASYLQECFSIQPSHLQTCQVVCIIRYNTSRANARHVSLPSRVARCTPSSLCRTNGAKHSESDVS